MPEISRFLGIVIIMYYGEPLEPIPYVPDHGVWIRFRDGTSGEVDLRPYLEGPMFAPLRNVDVFTQFAVHPEFETLVWPNGADLAPETLYAAAQVTASSQ